MNDEQAKTELARAPSPIPGLGSDVIEVLHVEDDPAYREAIATPAQTSIGGSPARFSRTREFPLPAVILKGTCDRAESATPHGDQLSPG